MSFLRKIPLLAIVLILYNVLAVSGGSTSADELSANLFVIWLPSGARLAITFGHALIALGVILLYFEILKATRTSQASIVDHGVSMLVFVVFLIELIVVEKAGTATFFILMLMSLVDVIAGYTVTISTARRDLAVDGSIPGL